MPRMLSQDAQGDDVKYLQDRLNSTPPTALPLLVADGTFGPETVARVQELQTNSGMGADGVVGSQTWAALLGSPVVITPGFFVLGRHLYDQFGTRVILRGVNKMCVFDNVDPDGLISFPEIKQTGANSVRIVWAITQNLSPGGVPTSTITLDSLITNAKAQHLIPMVELHDGTGIWSRLADLVSYWVQPVVVTIIQKHEAYLLLNLGNEVGDDTVSLADFQTGYADAIQQLRTAGIHTPLVIDASDWGKDLARLNDAAAPLLAADPDRNLVFSVHMYWSKSCGADAAFIQTNLQQAVAMDYPLIIGEFSRYGGYPCNDPAASICSPGSEIDYPTILATCSSLDLGWYAWEWGPGNAFGDPLCATMDMTPDRLRVNLKPGWAEQVAISSPFSIQNTSVTPGWI